MGIIAALAMALAVTAGGGLAQADTTIAHVARATLLNAYGGAVVWSAFDEQTQSYRLMAHRGGNVTALPVPPSDSVFDADLGVDASARLTVVYSRCAQPREKLPFIAAPVTADCDLYRYRFGTPAEERLTLVSRAGQSEFLPSIWGNRIAFGRIRTDANGGSCVGSVWTADIRTGRQRRLATGTLGDYKVRAPCHARTTPTSIDLRAKVVAFSWYYAPLKCNGKPVNRPSEDLDASELWLVRLGRGPRLIEGRCGGYRFTPVSLTRFRLFDMSFGSVIHTGVSYFAPSLRRFDLRSGAYFEDRQSDRDNFGVSDGKQIYVLRQAQTDPDSGGYDVVSKPLTGFERSRRDPGDD